MPGQDRVADRVAEQRDPAQHEERARAARSAVRDQAGDEDDGEVVAAHRASSRRRSAEQRVDVLVAERLPRRSVRVGLAGVGQARARAPCSSQADQSARRSSTRRAPPRRRPRSGAAGRRRRRGARRRGRAAPAQRDAGGRRQRQLRRGRRRAGVHRGLEVDQHALVARAPAVAARRAPRQSTPRPGASSTATTTQRNPTSTMTGPVGHLRRAWTSSEPGDAHGRADDAGERRARARGGRSSWRAATVGTTSIATMRIAPTARMPIDDGDDEQRGHRHLEHPHRQPDRAGERRVEERGLQRAEARPRRPRARRRRARP